jgi:ElaB/YqjD/DUF883 family membrane-anchored ribosome-binding protein
VHPNSILQEIQELYSCRRMEEVGKVTNDRNLKAKGKAEKKAGEVQQRIGRAKDNVAKL